MKHRTKELLGRFMKRRFFMNRKFINFNFCDKSKSSINVSNETHKSRSINENQNFLMNKGENLSNIDAIKNTDKIKIFQEGFKKLNSINENELRDLIKNQVNLNSDLNSQNLMNDGRGKSKSTYKRIVEVNFKDGMRSRKEYYIDENNNILSLEEYNNIVKDINQGSQENTNEANNNAYMHNTRSNKMNNHSIENQNLEGYNNNSKNLNLFNNEFLIGKNTNYILENVINLTFEGNQKLNTYYYPAHYEFLKSQLSKEDIINKFYLKDYESLQFKGVIILQHGLYDHSKNLSFMAKLLSNKGYDVHSFDLRGHGKSDGVRGLLKDKEEIIKDYMKFIKLVNSFYSNKNLKTDINLVGMSFGGLLTSIVSQRYSNEGILKALLGTLPRIFNTNANTNRTTTIKTNTDESKPNNKDVNLNSIVLLVPGLTSSSLHMKKHYSKALAFIKFLKWLRFDKLSIFHSLSTLIKVKGNISENKLVNDHYKNDNLIYSGSHRIGTALTIDEMLRENEKNMNSIELPILLVHGGNDKIVNNKDNENLFDLLKNNNNNKKITKDGMDHFINFDKDIISTIDEIEKWICNVKQLKLNSLNSESKKDRNKDEGLVNEWHKI